MSDTETDWAAKIGAPAMESIAEMVAALECDYDRLVELRDEANGYYERDGDRGGRNHWEQDCPDEAEELKELETAAGEWTSHEAAREAIEQDPLSVEVRSDWTAYGEPLTADEYRILLTTGGPAVCIEGDLSGGEPTSARLMVQDWGKPWTEYVPADHKTLLTYARCFYFGD